MPRVVRGLHGSSFTDRGHTTKPLEYPLRVFGQETSESQIPPDSTDCTHSEISPPMSFATTHALAAYILEQGLAILNTTPTDDVAMITDMRCDERELVRSWPANMHPDSSVHH